MGDYALGLGRTFITDRSQPQNPARVSKSSVIELSGNFQRYLSEPNTAKPAIYLSAGAGLVWSQFTTTTPCASGIACMFPRQVTDPVIRTESPHSFKAGFAAGTRVPVFKAIGIHAELKYWFVASGGHILVGGRGNAYELGNDHMVRATLGIALRHPYRHWASH